MGKAKIPHNCFDCGKQLTYTKSTGQKDYVYFKGRYFCKNCFMRGKNGK